MLSANFLDGPAALAWPLCSYLELGALPSAVPCARLHASQVLWEWGLSGAGENAELVVSELVTNAINASRDQPWPRTVRLWLLSDESRVFVLVWDGSPMRPISVHADEQAESGRGLLLIESISVRWDWFPLAGHQGKIFWAELSAE